MDQLPINRLHYPARMDQLGVSILRWDPSTALSVRLIVSALAGSV